LSDIHIREAQRNHEVITPFVDGNVQPASVDLTLGDEFIRAGESWFVDEWTILPGEFMLATTVETVHIPNNLVAQVNGKSSWARKGLIVHTTAGFIDPGFKGQITLELKNVGHEPIQLTPGVRICQIVFSAMTSAAEFPYGHASLGSQYQNQVGVTESAL
jgi:dCTP deaminase